MLRVAPEGFEVDSALAHYAEHGYARLGVLLDEAGLAALRERTDDLMLGRVALPGALLPAGRAHRPLRGRAAWGWAGRARRSTTASWRSWSWIRASARGWRTRSSSASPAPLIPGDIVIYRAILFHKGQAGGSNLPVAPGRGQALGPHPEPELQIWTALDDAPEQGGCLEVVPGSHRGGLVTPAGRRHPPGSRGRGPRRRAPAPAPGPGRARCSSCTTTSGTARARAAPGQRRRAFSVCYMSAQTRCVRKKKAPRVLTPVFRRASTQD